IRDGHVTGVQTCALPISRRAYQWTVEVTAYVHRDHHRWGVGLGLYTSLLDCLVLQGFRSAVGVIALPNPGSVGLHERMGFQRAEIGRASCRERVEGWVGE